MNRQIGALALAPSGNLSREGLAGVGGPRTEPFLGSDACTNQKDQHVLGQVMIGRLLPAYAVRPDSSVLR